MNIPSPLQDLANATQRGLQRLSAVVAGLSFWQFCLLAGVLIAAAGIAEDLWDRPAKKRIRVTESRSAGATEPGSARGPSKESIDAEIRINQDGVTIRRKKPATTPNGEPAAGTPEKAAEAAPAASEASGSAEGGQVSIDRRKKEIRIDGIDLTEEDFADMSRVSRHPRLVTIMLLLVLGLFVMRLLARAQQRAEKRADVAEATADREALQRQLVEARLQLLQAQVEPHFLFNTLAAVEYLIETAPSRAAQMQRHLIAYLRAALPRMRQQSASLGQEMELCVSYLKIMQMRMEERLKFNVNVPKGLESASLPPMLLQSLVENAIRHGLEPKPEGGSVELSAEVRDGKLCVTVADTGLGFSSNAGTGIGLTNIRERLQQLFAAAGTLTIEANSPAGTRATITIPYAVS